jgi:hypothetical protein
MSACAKIGADDRLRMCPNDPSLHLTLVINGEVLT